MRDIKVLFVGNSHTYMNDMPQLFRAVYEKTTGCRAEVTMLAYSGRHLKWHMDELFSLRFQLLYGGFDYCVIQQAAHPFPPEEETLSAAARVTALCAAGGVTPVFFMTWAEKRMPENQQKMIDVYRRLHAASPSLLAPVGVVWRAVRESHPEIELYYADGEHASPQGDLLIACVLCAALTGSPAVKAPDFMLNFKPADREGAGPHIVMNRDEVRVPLDAPAFQAVLEAIEANWSAFER
ncbi:MAG: hypothetical protein IJ048_13105 [Clostridia bacterium]|nr:hypothetical protein [Clostridia bacterium]